MKVTDTVLISPEIFSLGDFTFRLTSRNQQRLDEARKLYASTSSAASYQLFDLDNVEARVVPSQYATIFHALITDAYRHHQGLIYVDGCALVTTGSQLVFLAGASRAGKTTLTVAAAQKLGWKIVSEDLVLLDPAFGRIVPVVHPLSLRPGAQQLIAEATGLPPLSLYLDRWLACHDMFYTGPSSPPRFAHSILIDSAPNDAPFSASSLRSHELLRALLPLSNALSLDDGTNSLNACIEQSSCSIICGGTVGERLAFLTELDSHAAPELAQ
jgi:hypothetical protein